MKMTFKLIIIFSVMTVIVTLLFSMVTYQENLTNFYNNTATSLTTLGDKMKLEIEQYVRLMELSVDELSSNVSFMDSFETIYKHDSEKDSSLVSAALTNMTQIFYQAPLHDEFTRISAYNDNGFFITNVFDKTGTLAPFSEESKETVASIDALSQIRESPNKIIITKPQADLWSTRQSGVVFTLYKSAVWHGQLIGYFEVSADVANLAGIFFIQEKEGISTQAIFDDGTDLFRTHMDDVIYQDLPLDQVTTYEISEGSNRWVYHTRSSTLKLNIYVSQEIDALAASRMDIFEQSLLTILPILLLALLLIVLISTTLTASIRKLSVKIKALPADNFLSRADLGDPTVVVKPKDRELYELEQSFNTMLTTLRQSHANELTLREGTLKAQLDSLQTQINPHFIYNTLNIISAKGLESGSEEIPELCEKFALMLRYSTDVRSQTATVRQELENVMQYLILCKSRFEDMLEYEIDVPDRLMDITIPKLTLQPIVENCMKYGTRNAGDILHITIKGIVDDDELKLIVKDNGTGFDWDVLNTIQRACKRSENFDTPEEIMPNAHIGLVNTFRRLYYYSHGRIRMNLYNNDGAEVELILNIDGGDTDV